MHSALHHDLAVTSKQIEIELGARLPKHLPSNPASVTPTAAVIQLESSIASTYPHIRGIDLTRDLPEWVLTSQPMSRSHTYLISCLLLPVKAALRPLRSKIKDTSFFAPWPVPVTTASAAAPRFHRNEDLSYAEQLRRWHAVAMQLGAGDKIMLRVREAIIDPGPTHISSVYVRILLQMSIDAMGSYYVEHDLSLLNLDVITRQMSEGGASSFTVVADDESELSMTKVDTENGDEPEEERGRRSKPFSWLLGRRHSAS